MNAIISTNFMESESKRYQDKYATELELLNESYQARYGDKKTWSDSFDALAFGKYAEVFESYMPILEDDQTTRNDLGPVLSQGLDLVLAQYSALPMQFLASIQPLDQEAGVAYFRRAIATSTRAGITEGDELMGQWGATNFDLGNYTSETCVNDSNSIDTSVDTYTVKVPVPVAENSVKIIVGNLNAFDDGQGHILGLGIDSDSSTVDYKTGDITIKFSNVGNLTAGQKITIVSTQLLPSASSVPSFKWDLVSKTIQVKYWMLQSSYSTISDFIVRKKFGTALSEELVKDTVNQITGAVLSQTISKLRTAAIINESLPSVVNIGGGVVWNEKAPAGVSAIEHRRTFDDSIEDVVRRMEIITGKGGASFMIVGSAGRRIFRSLGVQDKGAIAGPHLMGFYGSIPLFYAPNNYLPADEILVGYRGDMWFEAPLVYSPFLPVTTVKIEGRNTNAFTNTIGTAHGAGLEIVAGGFVQRIRITNN